MAQIRPQGLSYFSGSLVLRELPGGRFPSALHEAPVYTLLPQKLVMGAFLGDPPVVDHKNLVGMADRLQAMRDHDDGLFLCQRPDRRCQFRFVLRVDVGCRLAEHLLQMTQLLRAKE